MFGGNQVHTQDPILFTYADAISVRRKPGQSAGSCGGTRAWHLQPGPAPPSSTSHPPLNLSVAYTPHLRPGEHTGPLRGAVRRKEDNYLPVMLPQAPQ